MLEASNNKVRMEWLRVLQQTRKIYYQSQIKADLEVTRGPFQNIFLEYYYLFISRFNL
jgi:hypothetical protein